MYHGACNECDDVPSWGTIAASAEDQVAQALQVLTYPGGKRQDKVISGPPMPEFGGED